MTPHVAPESGRVEDLTYAFAPVHKRALGMAVGAVLGSLMFAVTAFHVVTHPADGPPLELLAQYFYGYTVSWPGALVALFWGGVSGFVLGWFAALVRNVTVSIAVFVFKTKANLRQTADFLDHI
jgi:hypothetical protein